MAFLVSVSLQVIYELTPSQSGLVSIASAVRALFIRLLSKYFVELFKVKLVTIFALFVMYWQL